MLHYSREKSKQQAGHFPGPTSTRPEATRASVGRQVSTGPGTGFAWVPSPAPGPAGWATLDLAPKPLTLSFLVCIVGKTSALI